MDLVLHADIQHPRVHGVDRDGKPGPVKFPECLIDAFRLLRPADGLCMRGGAPGTEIKNVSACLHHLHGFCMDLPGRDERVHVKGLRGAVDNPHHADRSIPSDGDPVYRALPHALTFAARNVFSIRVAIVIGPTPPGTGVMAEAMSMTAAKSTSPTSFPSRWLIPTSITTAPGFTIPGRMKRALPTAEMRISARFSSPLISLVRLWQIVTVASALVRSAAIGLPTSILRPATTATAPETGIRYSARRVMIPVGVQGVNRGLPEKRRPRFSGWNPSTSFSGLTAAITRSASTCSGRGSWTRIPSISGSAFSRRTFSSTSAVVVSPASSIPTEPIPSRSHARCFMRTYIFDAGSFPAMTVA